MITGMIANASPSRRGSDSASDLDRAIHGGTVDSDDYHDHWHDRQRIAVMVTEATLCFSEAKLTVNALWAFQLPRPGLGSVGSPLHLSS